VWSVALSPFDTNNPVCIFPYMVWYVSHIKECGALLFLHSTRTTLNAYVPYMAYVPYKGVWSVALSPFNTNNIEAFSRQLP
jgi:hypothetical protein